MLRLRPVAVWVAAAALAATGGAAGAAEADDRVRPGLGYTSPTSGCSFSFILSGSDGRQYAATAGHCALRDGEEKTWLRGDGPIVTNDKGRAVGRFVYAVFRADAAAYVDFALIRLSRDIRPNPQMCAWGGPTRLLTEARTGITELRHHGQGLGISNAAPTRSAVARSLPQEPFTFVQGAANFGTRARGSSPQMALPWVRSSSLAWP